MGFGSLALASLGCRGGKPRIEWTRPEAGPSPWTATGAKAVIFLFMEGGPSQLELFDYKPELQRRSGEVAPASLTENQRFAFMDESFAGELRLLGTTRKFRRVGERGTWISELLPHTSAIADELTIVRSLQTNQPNHGPAMAMLNTGFFRYGRPSMGPWVTYALGSLNENLPGFMVLESGPLGPRGAGQNWSAGFLPTQHQGVALRDQGEPILELRNPDGVDSTRQQRTVAAINALNREAALVHRDPATEARIANYELAARMQLEAPAVLDLSGESKRTLTAYGADPEVPSFARNCLMARRLVESGVRFVQLYHTDWDHHGVEGRTLGKDLEERCQEVDRASAALVTDLKSRGLLDNTLIVWGGEFGRTPIGESTKTATGRNHHTKAGTIWLAGGRIRPLDYGQTDELGFFVEENPVSVHDLHATLLSSLGLDQWTLTYRTQGRDFRLTDTGGRVLTDLLG
jgi:hypothetical protein